MNRCRTPRLGQIRCVAATWAFTLIELLVVISIIALLISILLPTLASARRQVRLVMCSSNLHQIGVGVTAYVAEYQQYPPPCTQSVQLLYTTESDLHQWDNRQVFVDMVNGQAADMFFCPLWGGPRPPEGSFDQDAAFSEHFLTFGPAVADRAFVGYNLLFLIRDTWLTFDWTNSGTPGGVHTQELEPGDPQAPLLSDMTWQRLPGDWQRPGLSAHNSVPNPNNSYAGSGGPFIDTNSLYGDGHAVTRNACEFYVGRVGDGLGVVYFSY